MASLNMVGPYLLTEHEINANVEFGRLVIMHLGI